MIIIIPMDALIGYPFYDRGNGAGGGVETAIDMTLINGYSGTGGGSGIWGPLSSGDNADGDDFTGDGASVAIKEI